MRYRLASGLAFVAAILLAPSVSFACTCITGLPVCEALLRSSGEFSPIVFEGTVVSIERDTHPAVTRRGPFPYLRVTFRNVKNWIGTSESVVTTSPDDASCGYYFERGRRYVVHATRNAVTGAAQTGLCSQTRPIEQAAGFLAYLRSLSDTAEGGVVYGQALTSGGPFAPAAPSGADTGVAGVRVRLSGPVELDAVTGADGSYRFDRLPVGDYAVAFNLDGSRELAVRPASPVSVRIGSTRSCAIVDAVVGPRPDAEPVGAGREPPIVKLSGQQRTTVATSSRPPRSTRASSNHRARRRRTSPSASRRLGPGIRS